LAALGDGLGIHPVFPCEAYDYVNALAWGSVYAGGTFTNAGGTDSHHFARWITSVPSYSVSVSPPTAVSAGAPNETVTYTLQIRNLGSQTDTYTVTLGSANFPTQIDKSSVGALAPNSSETVVVSVTIPPSAGTEDSDTVAVTAVSHANHDVIDSSQLTTNVAIQLECQIALDEQFLDNTIPAGWTIVDNEGNGQVWRFDNAGGRGNLTGGVDNFAIVDSDNYGIGGIQDTELIVPPFDFSGATIVSLTFKTDFRWYDTSKADVDISSDGGTIWTTVWQKTSDYRGAATETVDISTAAAGHANVLVRFHYYDADNDWWWQVDDVEITECTVPVTPLGITGQKFNDANGDGLITFPRDYDVASSIDPAAFGEVRGVSFGDVNDDNHTDILIATDRRYQSLLFGYGDGSFSPDVTEYLNEPDGLWLDTALGDVNGDAILDMVLTAVPAPPRSSFVAVRLGQGGGHFADLITYTSPYNPSHIEMADMNGDTHLDLIVAASGSSALTLFINDGNGRFPTSSKRYIQMNNSASDLALADLDNDNSTDIIAITSQDLVVLLNNGTAVFTTTRFPMPNPPEHLSLGDIDNDNDIDILFTITNTAHILRNNGNGTFTPSVSQSIALTATDVILADVNGGGADLLLAYTNTVAVRLGDGSGMFAAPVNYAVGSPVVELHTLDIDADNNLDLIAVSQSNNDTISRLFGDGQGGFSVNRSESGLPNWIIFLDDDGDNMLDTGEISQTTDANGFYTFAPLTAGNYQVREVQQTGWQQTTPNMTTTVTNGLSISDANIGNFQLMMISGTVYYDQNENGVRDGGEAVQAGWTILLDENNNGVQDGSEITVTTDINGRYLLPNLLPKTFFVREIVPPGWKTTTGDLHILPALSGQTNVVDFGNAPLSISGYKFNDMDGNASPVQIFNLGGEEGIASKTGDINGDGFIDAVVLQPRNLISSQLSIFLGRADGTLQPKIIQTVSVHTPSSPGASHNVNDLELADLNGDQFDDIIVTMWQHPSHAITQVVTLMSQGNGTFGSAIRYESGSSMPQEAELADLNGDGHIDMVVVNSTHGSGGPITDTVSVFINKGDGTGAFKTRMDYFVPENGNELKLADMDGDNDIDIVVSGQTFTVLFNNNGRFNTQVKSTAPSPSNYLALSDVDGNGFPDIILTEGVVSTALAIYPNNGNGTFGTHTSVQIGEGIVLYADEGITAVDINNDSHPDILVPLNETIGLFLGNGDGTFVDQTDYSVGKNPQSVIVADFNQDNKPDLWVIHGTSKDAYLLNGDGQGKFVLEQESSLPNWTIFLDNNNNAILDSGDISTTTNVNGQYTFTVPLANYLLREVNQQDWVQTTISPTNMIANEKDIADVYFGNFKLATITGTVFHDLNGNRQQDSGDVGLGGWTVFLDENQNGLLDGHEISTTTAVSGYYSFTQITPRHHYLYVTMPGGWQASKAMPEIIAPGSGQIANVNFGAYQPINIGDFVWKDANIDGIQDNGETGVAGVTVTLNTALGAMVSTITTNANGAYTLTNVIPGQYYLTFTLPSGYLFSPQNQGMFDFNDSDANVGTGETAVFTTTSGVDQPYWDAGIYRPALIGDRIWNDTNYNGIQDGSESGMAGVTVTLYISGSTTPLKTTTSNANGDYSFSATPGSYWLKVTRPFGYIFTILDANAENIDSDVDAGGNTIPFTVSENENHPDWDAGLVERATVGNRIWRDVNGDGIQDGEEPGMYGITVTLRNGSGIIDTIITNGDGYYTFTQVTPGSYYIHVAKPTGWEYSPKQNPGAPDNDHDSDVDETSGETTYFTLNPGQVDITQDAGMYPLPATIGDRVWHDVDGDGIQDAGEAGMAGATVGLYFVGNTFPIATKTTDANGHYTFTNVLPSDYFLSFSPPNGYHLTARDQGGDDALDSDADSTPSSPTYAQTISFTVSAGDVITTWDAGVYQLGSIGDRVWLDTNRDGIQESSETIGMAGVTVTLHSGIFVITTTQTDNSGHYTFTNLFPNQYHLSFTPPSGYALSPQNQSANDALDSDPNPTSGQTDSFNIASGETVTYWDAGMYRTGIVEQNIYEHVWVVFDLVQSDGITETIYLAGNSHENIFFEGNTEGDAFDDDGNGRDDTLSLLATLAVTGSSSLGTVNMQLNPTFLSQGQLEEHINNTPGTMDLLPYALVGTADSFFDVFFTVEISGTTFTHTVPHRWNGVVRYSPSSSGWLTGISDATIVEINMPVNPTTYTVQNLRYVYGNYDEIRGVSYDDSNGNGVLDVGETALSGWGISLDNPPLTDTTLLDGSYRFGIPLPGTYTVTQTPQASWVSTTPPSVPIMITAPTTPTINFGLLRYASTIPLFPSSGGNLSFVNGQGDTTMLTFSNGAVNAATTLYLGNLDGSAAVRSAQLTALDLEPPDGYANIAHAFRLDAEQGGWLPPSSLQFDVPAALTIEYSDADMEDIDEDSLHLFAWNWASETWVDATENCTMTAQLDTNANQFTADLCQTGRYALFGQPLTGFEIYLPIITRP